MSKDLKYYLNLPYSYRITPDENLGFYVEIPELPGCRGDGQTIEEALEDIAETKRLWLEVALSEGYEIPLPQEQRKYSGQFLLRMPRSLHQSVAEEAKWENVSMNQYLNTLITECRHVRAIMHTHRAVGELQETVNRVTTSITRTTMTLEAMLAEPIEFKKMKIGEATVADAA